MLRRAIAGLTGLLLTAVLAQGASAATLVGDYQFQGTRASSGPGPTLLDVGGSNSFISDSVSGSSRQVLAFPLHSGVQMFPAGIGGPTAPYSVVTTFKLADITGYRRILDPSPGVYPADGIYELDGQISIYGDSEVRSPQVLLAPSVYATVAVTSATPTATKVFVNGNPAVQAPWTIDLTADTLRFFKDEITDTEDSAGAVSCIRVFQGVLSDSEVKAIGASPTCTAPPPAVVKKKCKRKRNHRHHAAAAKKHKKKCKKRKRK
jgi:hypothetical protein